MPRLYEIGKYDDEYRVPPMTSREDILALIDMAIVMRDREWFVSLTDRLKNMG